MPDVETHLPIEPPETCSMRTSDRTRRGQPLIKQRFGFATDPGAIPNALRA